MNRILLVDDDDVGIDPMERSCGRHAGEPPSNDDDTRFGELLHEESLAPSARNEKRGMIGP